MRRWIWWGVILFFVLFSLLPTFYEIGRRNDLHPERHFELVHNFYTDYNFYLSRIRQGREGAWSVQEKYTSEPHEGSYLQILYLLMGKVSAFVRVPWPNSGDTYHMARTVLAVTLLGVIAFAAKTVFQRFRWQMIGFLLAVCASTWPILVYHANEWRFGGYMPWWTIMDVLQRITFIPHMLAGQAHIIFLLIAMGTKETMRKRGNWIFLGLLALLLGIIFPPGLMFVFAVIGLYTIIDFVFQLPIRSKKDIMEWAIVRLGGPAVIGLISAPSLIYLSLVLRIYPWKRLVDFAMLHPQPFVLKEYILAVGPMLVLGATGMIIAFIRREKKLYLLASWVITWFICIIVFQYIPQESPLRFTEMMPQVPLGFFAAYLCIMFAVWGSTIVKKLHKRQQGKVLFAVFLQFFSLLLPIFMVILALCQMYGSWRWQKEFVDHKITATIPLVPTGSYVMYPLNDIIDAMLFIQDHTTRDTVILSETTIGNYIPVYSGNTVYVGHANTIHTEQKEGIVADFYSGRMGQANAQKFLTENNLHYIFFGPQEMDDGGLSDLTAVYPFLKEIYRNPIAHIYQW